MSYAKKMEFGISIKKTIQSCFIFKRFLAQKGSKHL